MIVALAAAGYVLVLLVAVAFVIRSEREFHRELERRVTRRDDGR